MIEQLARDMQVAPSLFKWNGPIDLESLTEWISETGLVVPRDLLNFWAATGGGEMFETESVLAPIPRGRQMSELETVNAFLRSRRMPTNYLVFGTGTFLSAVRQDNGAIVELDPDSFRETASFGSLDEWYRQLLRDEYAARYGLPPTS